MNRKMFERIELNYPEKLLFIGSGVSITPKEWLEIPSIRTNARTLGLFSSNKIFGIMTWPTPKYDGLGGVLRDKYYQKLTPKPYIFLFDQKINEAVPEFYINSKKLFHLGVKDKFNQEAFESYIKYTKELDYQPRNSTGLYLILWLWYANVKEIYISGFDGHLALSGDKSEEWNTKKVYKDILGNEWCPDDNKEIETSKATGKKNSFYYHNLYTEWKSMEDAIKIAEDRGVKVFVSKEQPKEKEKY